MGRAVGGGEPWVEELWLQESVPGPPECPIATCSRGGPHLSSTQSFITMTSSNIFLFPTRDPAFASLPHIYFHPCCQHIIPFIFFLDYFKDINLNTLLYHLMLFIGSPIP